MDDTHPVVKSEYQRRLMQESGEQRMMMGSRMFDACREIVVASLRKGLSDAEFRKALFLKFYGNEFDEEAKVKIVRCLVYNDER